MEERGKANGNKSSSLSATGTPPVQLDKHSLENIAKGVLQGLLQAGKEEEMPSGRGVQSRSSMVINGQVEV